MIVIATVRHTGTHFAVSMLSDHGFRLFPITRDVDHERPVWRAHTLDRSMEALDSRLEGGHTLLLTMRNPIRCAETWLKRGKALDSSFYEMWSNLFKMKEDYADSWWLPVDTPDRGDYLAAFSERIGVQLKTQWEPIFASAYVRGNDDGMTPQEAVATLDPAWFDQFGYDI